MGTVVVRAFLPVDPWAPGNGIDSQSIASSLFAASLFPYLGFLYYLTKSKTAPRLTLFGFYFLLAFVGATSERHLLPMYSFFELLGSPLLSPSHVPVKDEFGNGTPYSKNCKKAKFEQLF